MADYYSILKKTITGLSKNSPEVRAAVYAKARTAIEKQLRGLTPTPSEEAIAGQLASLETAISMLESEHVAQAVEPEEPPAEASAVLEPQTPAAPPSQEQTLEQAEASALAATEAPLSPPPPAQQPELPDEPLVEPPTVALPPEDGELPGVGKDESIAEPQAFESEAVYKEPSVGSVVAPDPIVEAAAEGEPWTSEHPVAPDVQTTAGALDAMSDAVQDEKPAAAPATVTLDEKPLAGSDVEKSKGSFGRIALVGLVLLLLGGAGYATWINRDAWFGESRNLIANSDEAPVNNAEPSLDTGGNEKEPVRIGENGEDASAGPVDEDSTASGETEIPAIADNEQDTTEEPDIEELAGQDGAVDDGAEPSEPSVEISDADTATENQTGEETVETTPAETSEEADSTAQVAQVDDSADTAPAPAPAAGLGGEIAYLYEEGSAGTGATRTNATVNWTLERQQVETGSPAEPVIIGSMEVPEKDVSIRIVIKRNADEALSASHLIELRFDFPTGFSGQGVEEIARFVMKNSEEARGEALVAVPVKVSEGFFLIALDNLPQAVEVNTQLLEAGSWIDIPVSYSTGQRALLTLEKGEEGKVVFDQAFADWKNRQ